jgi:hypothetical protein
MATRAFTNITTAIAPGGILPVTYGEDGLVVEFFKCQGGTVGDTTTIVPSEFMSSVRAILGSDIVATDDISTSGGTQVVLTHVASAASTSVNYSVALLGRRQA